MKKTFLIMAAVAAGVLAACSSDSGEEPEKGEGVVDFLVTNYELTSLDDVTRAAATSLNHLDMAIYDATDNTLTASQQTSQGDNGYGSFSATLPYGTYNVVLLGYDGSRQADLSAPNAICYADDYVPNFFCKTLQLTVSSPTSGSQTVALKRAVAAFNVKSSGDIPLNLSKVRIEAQGGTHHFNALTGRGVAEESRTYTYDVASYAGKTSISISFFTFLTGDEATMDFTVTALDEGDGVIRSREFSHVPMKINQRSTYTGSFFSNEESTQGFTLTLADDAWTETSQTY